MNDLKLAYSEDQTKQFALMKFAYIRAVVNDHFLHITLARPEKKNALHPIMMNELAYCLNYAHYEAELWGVILDADGDVFCAGADLKAFAGLLDQDKVSTVPEPEHPIALGQQFRHLFKPCLAVVEGPVLAGGFLIVGGCTHVYSTPEATYSLPEVKRGIWPMQVMASLQDLMPARQLLDWCMRAKTLTAEESMKVGLVSALYSKDSIRKEMDAWKDELRMVSPSAIRLGLKAWKDMQNISADELHPFLLERLGEVLQTQDAMEGLAAFREKRNPIWKGY